MLLYVVQIYLLILFNMGSQVVFQVVSEIYLISCVQSWHDESEVVLPLFCSYGFLP